MGLAKQSRCGAKPSSLETIGFLAPREIISPL